MCSLESPRMNGEEESEAEVVEKEVVTEVAVNNAEEYLDSFPPGYRFCPHDYELIVYYLKKKVLNETLPRSKIREVNLYHHNPDNLTEKYQVVGEREWYFFTPRDRKYRNGNRPNRAAGNGYWKATGADKSIIYNGATVGHRKALVFYVGKPPKGDKTNWIMHEYRVHAPPKRKRGIDDMRLDDWVLCRIYKKVDKFAKTKPEDEEHEPAANSSIVSDESSPVVMNENDLVEKNYDYNQIGDSNGLIDPYSDYLLQPPFQNNFTTIPHFTDVSLPRFSTFNGQVQHGFNYGAQPISFRPPVYNSGDRIFRSKYLKEDGWSSKARGPQEDVWGMGIPDLDTLSQFDFSNPSSYMVDPFLNFDMLPTNNAPNNPPMPTTD